MVVRRRILDLFVRHAGIEDELHALLDERGDVAVHELGGVAHRFAGHGVYAHVVDRAGGTGREYDAVSELGEKREPERIVFVHVQRPGQTDGAAFRFRRGQRLIISEQSVVFFLEQVGQRLGLFDVDVFVLRAALAAVVRYEPAAVRELGDREQAVVAAFAAPLRMFFKGERFQLVFGQYGGARAFLVCISAYDRAAVRAHQSRLRGTYYVASADYLEGAQHRFVEEGAALDDDFIAHFREVAHFYDLEQRVLDDGIREAGGYVAHARALFLRLFDAAVHEYGAARTEVDGGGGFQSLFRELFGGHAQRCGEGFDEAAAAGRARFVEQHVGYHAVLDLDALHVLPADVENELHSGQYDVGRRLMRHRFYLSAVEFERVFDEIFAVARAACAADVRAFGHQLIYFFEYSGYGFERVAAVGAVPRIEQRSVLVYERGLGRRRACVHAEEAGTFMQFYVRKRDFRLCVAGAERFQLFWRVEQRAQSLHLVALHGFEPFQPLADLVGGERLGCGQRRAYGVEYLRVFGEYRFLRLQRFDEARAELGQEVQGTAEECDVSFDGLAARQAGNRLIDDGLEHACRDVLFRRAVVDERLYVRLGENAAPRRDGVYGLMSLRVFVEPFRVRAEQVRHLVDESAGTARAGAVHALLHAAFEIRYLCVLAAQLYRDVGLRYVLPDGLDAGDDLLNEWDIQPVGHGNTAAARHRERESVVALHRPRKHGDDCGFYVRIMPVVARVQHVAVFVYDRGFYRCGPYVQAYSVFFHNSSIIIGKDKLKVKFAEYIIYNCVYFVNPIFRTCRIQLL